MRCLVLGASGFLGRQVYAALREDPWVEVVTAGRHAAHVDLWLDLTAAGPAEVAEVLGVAAPAVVVNCAGATRGDPATLARANVLAVAALLDGLGRLPYPARLVHLGCAAEYGTPPVASPIAESAPAHPVGPYAVSKLAGTELVLGARRHGVPAVVLRVFEPLGPGTPERAVPGRLAAAFTTAARTGGPARVGPLDGYRDFVDVRDVAAAVLAAATVRELPPPLLNIGSGRSTPLRELAAAMSDRAGGAPVAEDGTWPRAWAAGPWQRADLSAATAALAWRPVFGLEASVRDMWRFVAA